jgi:hypothetical protein
VGGLFCRDNVLFGSCDTSNACRGVSPAGGLAQSADAQMSLQSWALCILSVKPKLTFTRFISAMVALYCLCCSLLIIPLVRGRYLIVDYHGTELGLYWTGLNNMGFSSQRDQYEPTEGLLKLGPFAVLYSTRYKHYHFEANRVVVGLQ